jgi:hypothetical protein
LITDTPPQVLQITSQGIAIGVRQNLMSWCPWWQVYVTEIVLCWVVDLGLRPVEVPSCAMDEIST